MDFGPFGAGEILFIAALALVIFGPKRLPELAHGAGKLATRLRRATSDLRRTYEAELRESPDVGGLARDVEDVVAVVKHEVGDLPSLGDEVEEAVRGVATEGHQQGPPRGGSGDERES